MGSLTGPFASHPPSFFTPDFGQAPHLLVGRDQLVGSLRQGLAAGPRDFRFTSLLLGPRGSGKTVILNLIGDAARESGWLVLPVEAQGAGLPDRIAETVAWLRQTHESVPRLAADKIERTALKIKISVLEWQREAAREVRSQWSLRYQLKTLSEHAGYQGVAVLLLLDELHSGERSELRSLAADVQHISKNERQPLALLGAGLSEMKHTLLEDTKMTFFTRCHREDMPPLTPVESARFLSRTVLDAGGRFEGDALAILANASGALPYKMQLVGHYAWLAAGAPIGPIDNHAVAIATQEAARVLHDRVALPAWYSLNDIEQSYLRTLAELGGVATTQQIAPNLDAAPSTLARALLHLTNIGCVNRTPEEVEVGDVTPLASLRQILEEERRHTVDHDGATPQPGRRSMGCHVWMPRAHARCILTRGHAGGHRSR